MFIYISLALILCPCTHYCAKCILWFGEFYFSDFHMNREHVIHYNQADESDLFRKLDYYREHKQEARQIAMKGYLHSMKYHRSANTGKSVRACVGG